MKQFIFHLAFVLCAGLLIAGCTKDEEVLTGTIRGFVSDYANANQAIAGVTVTINSKGLTKTTGSDGRFEFSGLEPMTYSLLFSANNYQPTTKQVTVYAGETANCDVQLDRSSAQIDISPLTLTFGKNIDQASFSIINNGNTSFTYSISSYPDYVKVSPASGTVAAKGKQAVSISIINRKAINEDKNGQLTVNVGNNSYIVSFSVEAYQGDVVSIDVSPQSLKFDKDTEQQTFAITNNGNRDVNYNISNNLDILTVSPVTGSLTPGTKNTITVGVKDRKSVAENRTGQITIDIEGNTFAIAVSVDKFEEGNTPSGGGDSKGVVTNGLYAYFTFEGDTKDITDTELTATGIGTSFEDSFNGTQALSIPGKASTYLNIPDGLVDQAKMSISFWAKDLQDGHVFHAVTTEYYKYPAFLLAVEKGKLKFISTNYDIRYRWDESPSYTHNSLEGWHMITLVSDYDETNYGKFTTKLFLDGVYIDVITASADYHDYNNTTKFVLGGDLTIENAGSSNPPALNATRLTIDNLRVYKYRTLTDEEIKEIYNSEKTNNF